MSELDNLRPEVREALDEVTRCTEGMHIADYSDAPDIIRAELLRLTDDCARLVDCINAQPPTRRRLIDRAERAEAELTTLQNTINAQQNTMGAMKRKLTLAEGELAALKARIGGGWLCGVSNDACPGNFDAAIYCLPSRFRGKRVRLVVEE